ncbi:hypothetical protein [Bradyrhizobium sp. DOA1]|uniref:hypothetical protein n=1 Tax=Bradyrhizobium sp. DOA1 TaxID=1126616 RepID=UPI00077C0F73|nr:hypothetical protein [Bradyrhizobium sp. DOA1]KYG98523.1 hypothetical protein SE91_08380 [Bradyrhizobium sp. DOA1]
MNLRLLRVTANLFTVASAALALYSAVVGLGARDQLEFLIQDLNAIKPFAVTATIFALVSGLLHLAANLTDQE